jgi:hypothetical protein
MAPESVFNIGIIVCIASVAGAAIAAVMLRVSKARLNRRLEAEFGKRRR